MKPDIGCIASFGPNHYAVITGQDRAFVFPNGKIGHTWLGTLITGNVGKAWFCNHPKVVCCAEDFHTSLDLMAGK